MDNNQDKNITKDIINHNIDDNTLHKLSQDVSLKEIKRAMVPGSCKRGKNDDENDDNKLIKTALSAEIQQEYFKVIFISFLNIFSF